MPERIGDALQIHPSGFALGLVDRAATRILGRVAVGDPQALDERRTIRDVRVKRRLPMVIVEAASGFLLDLPGLQQLVESRRCFRDRAFPDRVSVRRLNSQSAKLVRVRTQGLREFRPAVARQPRLRLIHDRHDGLRALHGRRRGRALLDAAAPQSDEAVHGVDAVLILGGGPPQHLQQRIPGIRRLVIGCGRDLDDWCTPRRPGHTDRLPLSVPAVAQDRAERFGAADCREKRRFAPATRPRQHRTLLDAAACGRVQLVDRDQEVELLLRGHERDLLVPVLIGSKQIGGHPIRDVVPERRELIILVDRRPRHCYTALSFFCRLRARAETGAASPSAVSASSSRLSATAN